MSDSIWCRLRIGGEIKKSLIPGLLKNLKIDTGDTITFEDFTQGDLFKLENEHSGQFTETERFLEKNNISFARNSDGNYEYLAELRIFIPQVVNVAFPLDPSGNVVMPAEKLRQMIDSISAVTFETAAVHINSEKPYVKEFALHLLNGGDQLSYLKVHLDDLVPPEVPTLPPLKIITRSKK